MTLATERPDRGIWILSVLTALALHAAMVGAGLAGFRQVEAPPPGQTQISVTAMTLDTARTTASQVTQSVATRATAANVAATGSLAASAAKAEILGGSEPRALASSAKAQTAQPSALASIAATVAGTRQAAAAQTRRLGDSAAGARLTASAPTGTAASVSPTGEAAAPLAAEPANARVQADAPAAAVEPRAAAALMQSDAAVAPSTARAVAGAPPTQRTVVGVRAAASEPAAAPVRSGSAAPLPVPDVAASMPAPSSTIVSAAPAPSEPAAAPQEPTGTVAKAGATPIQPTARVASAVATASPVTGSGPVVLGNVASARGGVAEAATPAASRPVAAGTVTSSVASAPSVVAVGPTADPGAGAGTAPVASGNGATVVAGIEPAPRTLPATDRQGSSTSQGSARPPARSAPGASIEIAAAPPPKSPSTAELKAKYSEVAAFVQGYKSSDCFAALPILGKNGVSVSAFSGQQTELNGFRDSLLRTIGVLQRVSAIPVTAAQCQALSTVQFANDYPHFKLSLTLNDNKVASGSMLSGQIGNLVVGNSLNLIVIDAKGIAQDAKDFMEYKDGREIFRIPVKASGGSDAQPLLIMAISTPVDLAALQNFSGEPVKHLFQKVNGDLVSNGLSADIGLAAFYILP